MTYKEITELVKLINKSNLTEFKIRNGDFQLSIRTKKYGRTRAPQIVQPQQQIVPVQAPVSAMPVQPVVAPPAPAAASEASLAANGKEAETADKTEYVEVRSPMVGTFYRSAAPDKPPYKKVGENIAVGDVVCIVEAMKLFNEIESEVSGKIVKILIDDASPVEYDQVLFLLDPNA